MNLSEIKHATLNQLYIEKGKCILSQGIGADFSKRIERKIEKIQKQITKLIK